MKIIRCALVSARRGDQVPGVEITDPASPIAWEDLDGSAQRWATEGGYGTDEAELLYVVTDSAGDATWLPAGFETHRLPVEDSGLEGAFTMPASQEEADFLTSSLHVLAANGLRPELLDESQVYLPPGAVSFLAEECTEDEDGFITIVDGAPVMWIGGLDTKLTPA